MGMNGIAGSSGTSEGFITGSIGNEGNSGG